MKKLILLFTIFFTVTACVISCMAPKTEEATTTTDTLAVDSVKVDTSAVQVATDTTKK